MLKIKHKHPKKRWEIRGYIEVDSHVRNGTDAEESSKNDMTYIQTIYIIGYA